MKKLSRVLILTFFCLLISFSVSGCGKTVYTVSFNSNGGTPVASQTVEENAYVSVPASPTKDKCVFKGWYYDSNLQLPWVFETMQVKSNTTLYAKWEDVEVLDITFPIATIEDDGYKLESESGLNTVEHYSDFAFNLIVDLTRFNANNLIVTANGIKLKVEGEPTEQNQQITYSYILKNVTNHQTIEVSGVVKNTFSVLVDAPVGYDIVNEEGYDRSSVKYGNDYKFTVVLHEGYQKQNFEVFSSGELLKSGTGGVYTIENITNNQIITVMGVVKKIYNVTFNTTKNHASDFTVEKESENVKHNEEYSFNVTAGEKYNKTQIEDFVGVVINGRTVNPTFTKAGDVYTFNIAQADVVGDVFITINSTLWQENVYTVTLPSTPIGYTISPLSHTPIEAGGRVFEVSHNDTFIAKIVLLEGYQHCTDFRLNFGSVSLNKDIALLNGVARIEGVKSDGEISLTNLTPNNFKADIAEGEVGYTIIPISAENIEENGEFTFALNMLESHELVGELSDIVYQTYTPDNPHTEQNEAYVSAYGTANLTRHGDSGEDKNIFTISGVTGNLRIKLLNIKLKEYEVTLPDDSENVGFTLSTELTPSEPNKYVVSHGHSFMLTAKLDSEYSLAVNDIKIQIDGQEFAPDSINTENSTAIFEIKNITKNTTVNVINVLKNEYEVKFYVFVNRNGTLVEGQFIDLSGDGYIDELTYSLIVERGKSATPPSINNIAAPDGYNFPNVADEYASINWIGDYENINSNREIYANFIPVEYEIKFVLSGGENHPDNTNMLDGRRIFTFEDLKDGGLILKDATKGQYAFTGWFKDADRTIKLEGNEIKEVGNITLYADWVLEVGEGKAFASLHDAVNYSSAHDTILIYNGTYNQGAQFGHTLKIMAAPDNNAVLFNINETSLYQNVGNKFAFGCFANTTNITIERIAITLPKQLNVYGFYSESANLTLRGVSVSGGQYAIKADGSYNILIIEHCAFDDLLENGAYIWANTYSPNTTFIAEHNDFIASSSNSVAIKISSFENANFSADINSNNFASGTTYGAKTTAIQVERKQHLEITNNIFTNSYTHLGWENAMTFISVFDKTQFLNEFVVANYLNKIIDNDFIDYLPDKDFCYSDITIKFLEEEVHLANIYVDCLEGNRLVYDILSEEIASDIFYSNKNIMVSTKLTMTSDKTVFMGNELYIAENLVIAEGATLTVEGGVYTYGNIENNGSIILNGGEVSTFGNEVMLGTTHEDNLGVNISELNLTFDPDFYEYSLSGYAVKTPENAIICDYMEDAAGLYLVAFRVYVGVELCGQAGDLLFVGAVNYYTDNIVDNFGYVSLFADMEYDGESFNLQQIEVIPPNGINIIIHTHLLQPYLYDGDDVVKETTISYDADINSLYFHYERNDEGEYFAEYNVYGMAIEESNSIIDTYFDGLHSSHFIAFKYYVGLEYAGWEVQENWAVDVTYEYRNLGGILNDKKNGLAILKEDEKYYNTVDEQGFLNYIVDVCVFENYSDFWANEKVNLRSFTTTFNLDGNDYEVVIKTGKYDENNMLIKERSLTVYNHWLESIVVKPAFAVEEGINTSRLFASINDRLEGAVVEVKENAQVKNLDAFKTDGVYDGSNWFFPVRIWAGLDYIGRSVEINNIEFVGNEDARYHLYNQVLNNGYIEFIVELTDFDVKGNFHLTNIIIDYTVDGFLVYNKNIEITSLKKYQDSHISPIMKNNLLLGVDTGNYTIIFDEINDYYNVTSLDFKGTSMEETPKAFEHYNAVKGHDTNASGYFIAFNAFVGAKNFYEEITVNIIYKDADGQILDHLTETRTLFVNAVGFVGVLLDGMVQDEDEAKCAGYSTVQLDFGMGENVTTYLLNISSIKFVWFL